MIRYNNVDLTMMFCGMLKSDPIIKTKLHLPYTRPKLVLRSPLQEKLARGLEGPLTLVTAPAGFGKTTLIASHIKDHGTYAAWLSLDKKDNTAERFLRYFITALQELNPTIGHDALQLLGNSPQCSPEQVFTSLINDLVDVDNPMVLVLDDYQFINSIAIHEGMTFFLEHCPNTFHLVIASRSDPPLPIPRFRARAQLVEFRASDLSFSNEEAAQFLNTVMGLRLDMGTIEMIKERTEGWIAGLQMASLSMRNSKDVDRAIVEFSGTNRYILDYLVEEVLANQPQDVQQFLLSTSILDNLTSPLCDAIMTDNEQFSRGIEEPKTALKSISGRSTAMLEYLEQANIFLVPLDAERDWYRYHHLFTDLLQARLKMTYSREAVSRLHTLAAQWYEKNGYAYEAIHHASLVPNDVWVERLIEQNYMEMFQRKDSASIRAWTGSLSKELILKSPKLSIHEAMSLSWIGQLDESVLLLTEAEQILQAKDPTPETRALLGHLAYVKSRVIAMQGDYLRAIQLCLQAKDTTPKDNYALQGGIGVMLGYAYFLAGDFEKTQQALTKTIHLGKVSGAVNTTIGAYCVLGRLYSLQGQLHQSFLLYQEAEKFVKDMGGQHRGAASIIQVGFSEIYYQWNDLENASAAMQKAQNQIHLWGKVDDMALAHTLQAFIHQAQDNLSKAFASIQKGLQLIRSNGVFPEARGAVKTTEVRLHLMLENDGEVALWLSSWEEKLGLPQSYCFENESFHIILARVLMKNNRFQDASMLLTRLDENARSNGRISRLIEILILQAVAMQHMGDNQQAWKILEESLGLARQEKFTRIYLDEGQPLKILLTQCLPNFRSESLCDYGEYLLAQFDAEAIGAHTAPPEALASSQNQAEANERLVEPLSQREIEVLQLIALGKTNLEIAQHLVVARGTIKAHAASIYRKLDVTNRTEAVAKARQFGILQ